MEWRGDHAGVYRPPPDGVSHFKSVRSLGAVGPARSWQMENRGTTMLRQRFNFGVVVDRMRKDLGIVLDEGRRSGAQLPITALID